MTENSSSSRRYNEIYNYASSMLPLMDVIFILLFFLMAVAIQKAVVNQLRVNLPKVSDSYGAQKDQQISIEMALGGQVSFDGNVYPSIDAFISSTLNIPISV
ncbi:ExbD/TolR family protein, partial [Planctomycetota bacterium]